MSEATNPEEQQPSAAEAPAVAPPSPTAEPSPRGNRLVLLALLLGAAGVAVGGWSLWQMRSLEARDQLQLAQLDAARVQTETLTQRTREIDVRLQQLPAADELDARRRLIAQLQGDQQLLNQRLETVLGASRQDWRLAEAEHLLRLASLRLSALQDIDSAEALVQGADEILRGQDDPAAFAAREQLAKSLEALRATVNPDRTGLFLQLAALREQAAQLHALTPTFASAGGVLSDLAAKGDGSSWWAEWLETLSQYFRIDFSADQNIRPLLAGQSLTQVRLALSLALEQAQWAALHGQTPVYRQALVQAREVLDAHFDLENPSSRALRARFEELLEQPVEVVAPDLSAALNAVQAYIQRKQSARERVESAAALSELPVEAAPNVEETGP
ncbi:uroporphyrinogen-III C-methyltransferase [Pseudomonas sp. sp1636]|uniref:uroporphyrinogen-III C-methyltransferase n=1 Tax=Pseudomonas sp. sp1636 TaxID=3036707 RepID=UPI0025A5F55A|nr:uroporphyrinogen-III C-methyltransferase [Pseudomonas sp. sp1636]MDM8348668.1 uroporphyrinogen-III C-methyltransferase [Pseudomonas sp. sp1636]